MRRFACLLRHEIRLSDGIDGLLSACFFFTVLLASPTVEILTRAGFTTLFWLTALLACLLASDRLFVRDYNCGLIDQVLLSSLPLPVYVAARLLAWLAIPGAMIIAVGCLAEFILYGPSAVGWVALSLVAALPGMIAVVGMVAALVVDAKRGVSLVVLAVLPLTLPIIVFGTASLADRALNPLLMLAGVSLINVSVAPYVVAVTLKDAARR